VKCLFLHFLFIFKFQKIAKFSFVFNTYRLQDKPVSADIKVPENWKVLNEETKLNFVHSSTGKLCDIDKTVTVWIDPENPKETMLPLIEISGEQISLPNSTYSTAKGLERIIRRVHSLTVCKGSGIDGKKHKFCSKFVESFTSSTKTSLRCKFCQKQRRNMIKNKKRLLKTKIKKQKKGKAKTAKLLRQSKKVRQLSSMILKKLLMQ
jgi:hypothetical protein